MNVEAQTGDEDVTFILHKVLFDFDKMPEEMLNDGYWNSNFANYETLNGAKFEVYDVTDEFNGHISKGLSTEDAQETLAITDISAETPLKTGTTSGAGTVEFTLPSSTEKNTVYLFHESNVPAGIKERATNLVVVLPYLGKDGNALSPIHLYPKNETERILIEKEVLGDVSYEIGEPIAYEIRTRTPKNPQDYTTFRIRDEADSVLLFNAESLVVTIGNTEVDELYTLDPNTNGFTLNFDVNQLDDFRDQEIIVRYEMTLSPEAMPDVNYFNEASVQYDNQSSIDRDLVRTGGYRFIKVDLRDENTTLADARFILRNESGNYLMLENGNYSWIENSENATQLVSGEDGLFEITGLRYGRYYLEEIEAPEGYVLSDTEIPFDVMNGTFSLRAAMNVVNQPDRPRLPITGGDVPTPERPRLPITRGEEPARPRLPITGEMNTIIFGVIGVAFIVLALVILNSRKREEREGR